LRRARTARAPVAGDACRLRDRRALSDVSRARDPRRRPDDGSDGRMADSGGRLGIHHRDRALFRQSLSPRTDWHDDVRRDYTDRRSRVSHWLGMFDRGGVLMKTLSAQVATIAKPSIFFAGIAVFAFLRVGQAPKSTTSAVNADWPIN